MEFFEIMLEEIFEVTGEGYLSLCFSLFPNKFRSELSRGILVIALIALSCVAVVGGIFGVCMLVKSRARNIPGWLLVGLALAYFLGGILLKMSQKKK